jgi:hypothetical protein
VRSLKPSERECCALILPRMLTTWFVSNVWPTRACAGLNLSSAAKKQPSLADYLKQQEAAE